MQRLSASHAVALIVLRTLIGWHFLYEGYYKLLVPGWARDGVPQAGWTAAGYLKAASGPGAGLFQGLAESGAIGWVDVLIPAGLVLVGASLILGLFTQAGCWGALVLLTLFYVTSVPTGGRPLPGHEGTYLLVNKTLIEWAAVMVLLVFRTGQVAGLDLVWQRRAGARHGQTGAGRVMSDVALRPSARSTGSGRPEPVEGRIAD